MQEILTPTPEQLQHPREHLLTVDIGKAILLIPGTPEYEEFYGLKTGDLDRHPAIVLYILYGEEAILGMGHSFPAYSDNKLVKQFENELKKAGINARELWGGQVIPDRENRYPWRISRAGSHFRAKFPNTQLFPPTFVSYSMPTEDIPQAVLLRSGRLIIPWDGRIH